MSQLTVTLADTMDMQHVTQYGLRFPDGSIDWSYTQVGPISNKQTMAVDAFINSGHSQEPLERTLVERAKAASVDLDEYRAGYSFVKRTVVVAVTDPEVIRGLDG